MDVGGLALALQAQAAAPPNGWWNAGIAQLATANSNNVGIASSGTLIASVGGQTTATNAYDTAGNVWTAKTADPSTTGPAEMIAASTGGVGYVWGGSNGGGNLTYAYDFTGNTWTAKANVPAFMRAAVSASVGGALYSSGGLNSASGPQTIHYSYDPTGNVWTSKANALAAHWDGRGGSFSSTYIATGGENVSSAIDGKTDSYDTVGNVWTAKTSDPIPRFRIGGGALEDGLVHVVGGFDGSNGMHVDHNKYDPVGNTWTGDVGLAATWAGGMSVVGPDARLYLAGSWTSSSGGTSTIAEVRVGPYNFSALIGWLATRE